jgi:hypothetical protein
MALMAASPSLAMSTAIRRASNPPPLSLSEETQRTPKERFLRGSLIGAIADDYCRLHCNSAF